MQYRTSILQIVIGSVVENEALTECTVLFTGVRRIGAGHAAAAVERVSDRVPQPRKQGIRVRHLSLSLVVDRREIIPQRSTTTTTSHHIITPK